MTLNFELLKGADPRTKDIVNGFIKNSQVLLPNEENAYYNIPSLVFMMTLLYYYNPEYFTKHGRDISLNETKNIAHLEKSAGYSTVYGNITITKKDQGKHIWTFNISEPNKQVIMTIGIDSSAKRFLNADFNTIENECAFYGYQCYGEDSSDPNIKIQGYLAYNDDIDTNRYSWRYGTCYSAEVSIVKMVIDMDDKTIRYFVNDEDQSIAFKDICFDKDEEYTMCVSMDETVTIQLIDYQHIM